MQGAQTKGRIERIINEIGHIYWTFGTPQGLYKGMRKIKPKGKCNRMNENIKGTKGVINRTKSSRSERNEIVIDLTSIFKRGIYSETNIIIE